MAFQFTIATTTPSETFTIPCQNVGTFNATVDWGDGGPTSSITAYNDADLVHTYATAGTYQISITGTFPNIFFNNGGDKLKVQSVEDLGNVGWLRLDNAFYGCSNMTSFASGTTDTSSVTNMSATFLSCSSLTSLDVSAFDTSSVISMSYMFYGCSSLTSIDLNSFNTSSAVNMTRMFYGCSSFTILDLSSFDTSSVTNMSYMFFGCSSLTSLDVGSFNTSSVTNMGYMFQSCSSLTTVNVSSFNTSSVTNMEYMFLNCSSLTGLSIRNWDVRSVTNGTGFLQGANNALSTEEYNAVLVNWSQLPLQSGVTWHFGDATYDENHPDTRYYLDFDGVDDNLILPGTDFGSSTNATLYKTFRGDSTDTSQIMFASSSAAYILVANSGDADTTLTGSVGSPVYREDGTIASYANRGDVFTALVDNTDHTIGVEQVDLTSAVWTSVGFYIGGELGTQWDNTGRLYSWAAVDTRLDGRNRDLLENFMISKKTS